MTTRQKKAPDWFGCGRVITQESWDGFLAARRAYCAKLDEAAPVKPIVPAWTEEQFLVSVVTALTCEALRSKQKLTP